MHGLDPHNWTPIFAIAGAAFVALSIWMARDVHRRRTAGAGRETLGQIAGGVAGMVIISLFVGVVVWGVADAWIFGGGIPSEYEPFSRR